MTAPVDRRTLAFAAVASTAVASSVFVVAPALATAPRADVLAAALAVDLAVLVPLAFAVLVAPRVGWWTVGPAALAGLALAWAVLPEAHRGVLDAAWVLVPVAEVAVVGAALWALARHVRRGGAADPVDRLRAAAERVLPGAAGRALAHELAVVRFALGPSVAPAEGAFPARRSSGYGSVLAGVAVAAVVELVGGHVLVRHLWGDGAALVHLALSGYAMLWLVGDWRALGARATALDGGTLRVRCGLRWAVDVPLDAIEAVYHVRRALPADRPTVRAAAGPPRFAIDTSRPVLAEGPYGVRREVTRVAVGADDPEAFVAALEAALRAGSEIARD